MSEEPQSRVCCDACKQEAVLDMPKHGPVAVKDTLPRRWRPRRIDGRVYILCDICGNLMQFSGGLSRYLQELLNLPFNVEFETPEYDELIECRSAGVSGVRKVPGEKTVPPKS